MTKKSRTELIAKKSNMTTNQVANFTRVSCHTLYVYVRTFPEFFSPSARKPTSGRRWTLEDLEMIQAIRSLYQERAGSEKIRELLAGGWKLQNVQIWTKQFMALMMEQNLITQEELKEATKETVELKRMIEARQRDEQEFQALWIRVRDLEAEWKVYQKAMGIRTPIVKALKIKKKYHGKLPELYPPRDD